MSEAEWKALRAVSESIFTTPRRGYLGQRPMGAEYMAGIEARARMLRRATRLGDEEEQQEDRQMKLPSVPAIGNDNRP